MAWPTTFPVARANVLIAGLRIREVTEVFLFVALGDRSRGICWEVGATGMCWWPQPAVRAAVSMSSRLHMNSSRREARSHKNRIKIDARPKRSKQARPSEDCSGDCGARNLYIYLGAAGFRS